MRHSLSSDSRLGGNGRLEPRVGLARREDLRERRAVVEGRRRAPLLTLPCPFGVRSRPDTEIVKVQQIRLHALHGEADDIPFILDQTRVVAVGIVSVAGGSIGNRPSIAVQDNPVPSLRLLFEQ
jgi:hypothetical protein